MSTSLMFAIVLLQFVHNSPNMPVLTPPTLRYSVQPQLGDCRLTPPFKFVTVVSITVSTAGDAQNVRVAHSSGNPCVDKQSVAAGVHFRFSPALKESKPIPTTIQLTMNVGRER